MREKMGDVELDARITKVGARRLVPLLPALTAYLERYRSMKVIREEKKGLKRVSGQRAKATEWRWCL